MTTTKSYSNSCRFLPAYKASLRKLFPLFIIVSIIVFALIDVVYFSYVSSPSFMSISPETLRTNFNNNLNTYYISIFQDGIYIESSQNIINAIILAIAAVSASLIANNYLHSKKMVDLYHALPVRRPQLLSANFLASMTVILVPFYIITILTVIVQSIGYGKYGILNAQYFSYILSDLIGTTVYVAVVYLFTTFIAVNVGTAFDAFAITGVLGVAPLTFYGAGGGIWAAITYGAYFEPTKILYYSPFTFYFQRFANLDSLSSGKLYTRTSALYLGWVVIGLILFLASIKCYNRRKSELAEQTAPDSIFQMLAKCFATFCGACIFLAIFFERGLVSQIIALFIGALLAGVIAELILARGVTSILKSLKWLVVFGIAWCLLFILAYFDIFGYVKRVPKMEDIESVSMSYRGRFENLSISSYDMFQPKEYRRSSRTQITLRDKQAIEPVLNMHKLAVQKYSKQDNYNYNFPDEYVSKYINLEYTLKNGKTIKRLYNNINNAANSALIALENQDEFIRSNHSLFFIDEKGVDQAELIRSISLYSATGIPGRERVKPNAKQLRMLLDAMKHDMLAESLEQITEPTTPALGSIQLYYKEFDELSNELKIQMDTISNFYSSNFSTVIIQPHYTRTIEALKAMDLLDALIQEDREIEKVLLYNSTGYYDQGKILIALTSQNGKYQSSPENFDTIEVTDPASIQAIQNAARNQLLIKDNEAPNYLFVDYVSEGQLYSGQYIHIQDLPAEVREQWNQNNKMEQNIPSSGEGIIGGADGSTDIYVTN